MKTSSKKYAPEQNQGRFNLPGKKIFAPFFGDPVCPVLNFIFKAFKAIPIASKAKDPKVYETAFQSIAQALDQGNIVCIFPKGRLPLDGRVGEQIPGEQAGASALHQAVPALMAN